MREKEYIPKADRQQSEVELSDVSDPYDPNKKRRPFEYKAPASKIL